MIEAIGERTTAIETRQLTRVYGERIGGRSAGSADSAGRGLWIPRPERCRQDDHVADAARPDRADVRIARSLRAARRAAPRAWIRSAR